SDLPTGNTTRVPPPGGTSPADKCCFDPGGRLGTAPNTAHTPPFATLISTKTYTVVKTIPFDGSNGAPKSNNGAEQCQWSFRTGKFYISIPGIAGQPAGTGGVAVVRPGTTKGEGTITHTPAKREPPPGRRRGRAHHVLHRPER